MKSRWGLDCNLCPDLVLIATCFFILAYYSLKRKKQTSYYILAFSFLAVSAYAYGVSWFMLPFMTTALVIYLVRSKKISTKQLLWSSLIMILLAIPIILFAYNLFFGGEEFKLGPITIISMEGKRHAETTLMNQDPFIQKIGTHIYYSIKLLIKGIDTHNWNYIGLWGQFYNIIGIPFIVYFFFIKLKNKNFKAIDIFFIIWAISCLPILIFVSPNVNHWNLLWFPLIYCCGCGIYMFIHRFKKMTYIIIPLFTICFLCFIYQYFDFYSPQNKGKLWKSSGFNYTLEEIVKFVKQKDLDNIYYSGHLYLGIDNGATMVLFHQPMDPHLIKRERRYNGSHNLVKSCGKDYFFLRDSIIPKPKTAYVIFDDRSEGLNIDFSKFNKQSFESCIVLWND